LTAGFIAVSPTVLRRAAAPESYPSRLQALLAARYTAQTIVVDNRGLNGEWAHDGQFRIVKVLGETRPEVAIILEGANDLSALGAPGLQPTLDALENMLRDARAYGAQVIMASLPPARPGSRLGGPIAALVPELNQGIRRMAERQRVLFADVHAAFGGDLSLLGPDGLHPTAAGYERMAQAVFEVIRANFEQASPAGAVGPARPTAAAPPPAVVTPSRTGADPELARDRRR
jgi:lysophospholipase L1-like esterase